MTSHRNAERGNSLLLVMIVLLVLSLLAAASLRLAWQQSSTINRRIHNDTLHACAEAAERKLLADYSLLSGASAPPVVMPNSNYTMWMAPGHFDSETQTGAGTSSSPPTFSNITLTTTPGAMVSAPSSAIAGNLNDSSSSNSLASGSLGGSPFVIVAHCTDVSSGQPREYEVELQVRLGI